LNRPQCLATFTQPLDIDTNVYVFTLSEAKGNCSRYVLAKIREESADEIVCISGDLPIKTSTAFRVTAVANLIVDGRKGSRNLLSRQDGNS
jgi:hypothetical protein